MKTTIRILSVFAAFFGGILAYSDQIKPIADLNPWLAHRWMFFTIGATLFSRGGVAAVDWLTKKRAEWALQDAQDAVKPPAPKLPLILLAASILSLSGCAYYESLSQQRKDQIGATVGYVEHKVAGIILNAVVSGAVNSMQTNVDYAQGLAYGLRSQEGNLLTSNDIKSLVDIWTPDKGKLNTIGNQLAAVYAVAAPKVIDAIKNGSPSEKKAAVAQSAAAIEAIAKGIDAGTKKASFDIDTNTMKTVLYQP